MEFLSPNNNVAGYDGVPGEKGTSGVNGLAGRPGTPGERGSDGINGEVFNLSVYVSVCVSVCLSVCLTVFLSVCPCLPICLSAYLPVCTLFVCLILIEIITAGGRWNTRKRREKGNGRLRRKTRTARSSGTER